VAVGASWRRPALAVLLVLPVLAPLVALAGARPLGPGALAALLLVIGAPVLAAGALLAAAVALAGAVGGLLAGPRAVDPQLAKERGYRYVHSGNEPLLIAGVATETLEILEEQPRTDVIIVPIGGAAAAADGCIVAKAASPAVRIIGVQSEAAPGAFRSWQERRLVVDRMRTVAEGLATRTAFELPQQILWQWLDAFVLVSDDEILSAQKLMIEATRNLVEAAGAAPLAAGLRLREELNGKRVALILSGGNASREQLLDVLGRAWPPSSIVINITLTR
jgi:threonine dehydratase